MKTNMYKEQFDRSVTFSKDFKQHTLDNLNALMEEKEDLSSPKKQSRIITFVRYFSAIAAVLAIASVAVFVATHHLSQPQNNVPVASNIASSENKTQNNINSPVSNDTDDSDSSLSTQLQSQPSDPMMNESTDNNAESTSSAPDHSTVIQPELTDNSVSTESDADTPPDSTTSSEKTDEDVSEQNTDEDTQNSTSRKHNYNYTVNNGNITVSDSHPNTSDITIEKGTEITFEVYLESNTALCAIGGSVSFDSSCLTLSKNSTEDYDICFDELGVYSVDSATGYGNATSSVQAHCEFDDSGKLIWECADTGRGFDFSNSPSLVRVTFVATEDINCNSFELMKLISFSYDEIFDVDFNEIPRHNLNGSITLEIG